MQIFSSKNHARHEQFPLWREVVCEQFTALNPVAKLVDEFESKVDVKNLLDVKVYDVSSRAQAVYRGQQEIRRVPSEYYFANLQISGQCVVRQDGREVLIRPGDFYLVDTTRTYDLIFEDWRILCVRMPRNLLSPLLMAPRASTAIRISSDGGMGSVTGQFMRSLLAVPDHLPLASQQSLTSSLSQLLAATLGASAEGADRSREAVRRELFNTIEKYIDDRAAISALSAESVAAKFHVSIRYFHKLLEEHGTSFGRLLLRCRLQHCAADLHDPRNQSKPVSAIAFQWGFNNSAHFSRVFRDRFGLSPTQHRAARACPEIVQEH